MKHFLQHSTNSFSLLEGEKIEMLIRHHWISIIFIWLRWFFLGPLLLACLGAAAFFFTPHLLFTSGFYLFLYFFFFYFFFLSLGAYLRWINSVFDVLIVSNERVISLVQTDFFHRSVTETRLHHVQDATGSVKGLLNTLFHFGSLTIMTASNSANMIMEEVPNPTLTARNIFILIHKHKKSTDASSFSSEKIVEDSDYHHPFFGDLRTEIENVLAKK